MRACPVLASAAVPRLALLPVLLLALVLGTAASPGSAADGAGTLDRRSGFDPRSARVPSVCGYPAGRLVNGRLPGTAEGQPVKLKGARTRASGRLGRATGRTHVISLSCRGFHAIADVVLVYDWRGRPVRKYPLERIFADPTPESENSPFVVSVTVRKRAALVKVRNINQPGDSIFAGGTSFGLLKLTSKRGRIRVASQRRFNEIAAFGALMSALEEGDRARALRFAVPEVVDEALRLHEDSEPFSTAGCVGVDSPRWPSHVEGGYGRRLCMFNNESSLYGFVMKPTSFRHYRAERLEGLAG